MSDALDATPPCGACGGTMVEHHMPAEEGVGPECWWYRCRSCGWEYGNNGEHTLPLTMRTAPWTAPVVAAVLAVLDERIAALDRSEMLFYSIRRDALKAFRREVSGE